MGIFGVPRKDQGGGPGPGRKPETNAPPAVTLQKRISLVLSQFDERDKEALARQLVVLLELEQGESLAQKVVGAFGRDLSREEIFRLDILERIAKDRNYFQGSDAFDAFPDDMGAPKSGL